MTGAEDDALIALRAERDAALDRVGALEALVANYRVGRRTTEKLHDRLHRTRVRLTELGLKPQ